MRLRPWLLVAALSASAYAQPDPRDHRRDHRGGGGIGVDVGVDVHVGGAPTEAPPPPQAETHETRAGFVWIAGQWDWKDGKYAWTPGHWERERAGKHWRESRWEQKDGHWQLTAGAWEEGTTPPPVAVPPPAGDAPTMAPPAPPAETHEPTRAGFVWVTGNYEWRDGKYNWVPGHWEREQAGKHWRDAHWDQHDGKWVRTEGGWDDGAGAAPPPPLPPNGNPGVVPPTVRDHRHDWKLERPTVSSYWPTKGKAGTKVVIHGVYFPAYASVLFGGKKVVGALVTPTTIEFLVPGDYTGTGDIAIDRGHGRPLAVGTFEVAAGFDWAAEQKRMDDERRKHAEAEWNEQQKAWAKDKAAREAAFHQREQELEQTRDHRREQRMQEIRAKWNAAFLADADTQDELTLHAQRLAELQRMRDVASVNADAKLGVRIDVAQQKENDRHDQRMQALEAAFKTKAGAP